MCGVMRLGHQNAYIPPDQFAGRPTEYAFDRVACRANGSGGIEGDDRMGRSGEYRSLLDIEVMWSRLRAAFECPRRNTGRCSSGSAPRVRGGVKSAFHVLILRPIRPPPRSKRR